MKVLDAKDNYSGGKINTELTKAIELNLYKHHALQNIFSRISLVINSLPCQHPCERLSTYVFPKKEITEQPTCLNAMRLSVPNYLLQC